MLPNIRRTLGMTARAAWRALHALFKNWHTRRRTLRALADLNDRELRDIGLTRYGNDSYCPLSGVDDTKLGCVSKAPQDNVSNALK